MLVTIRKSNGNFPCETINLIDIEARKVNHINPIFFFSTRLFIPSASNHVLIMLNPPGILINTPKIGIASPIDE